MHLVVVLLVVCPRGTICGTHLLVFTHVVCFPFDFWIPPNCGAFSVSTSTMAIRRVSHSFLQTPVVLFGGGNSPPLACVFIRAQSCSLEPLIPTPLGWTQICAAMCSPCTSVLCPRAFPPGDPRFSTLIEAPPGLNPSEPFLRAPLLDLPVGPLNLVGPRLPPGIPYTEHRDNRER